MSGSDPDIPDNIDGPTGGPISGLFGIEEYINRDATLLGKVDFLRMIRDIGKGAFLLVGSAFVGWWTASRKAAGNLYDAFVGGARGVADALFTAPSSIMDAAVAESSSEIEVFGILALPASAAVTLATFAAIAAVGYLFFARWSG